MENISCFNYANLTFESKQAPVSLLTVLEGLVGISIVWICCVYVICIAFYIIKYLSGKAPNLQTILDGFYIQYFVTIIGLAGMIMILQFLIELNAILHVENQIITEIVAWVFHSSTVSCSLSLATSCIARMLLIFWPSEIEAIEDKKIWLLNG